MLIILLLFFLLLPSKILAVDPVITVNPITASVVAGNQFNVNFSVINSEIGTTFFYKIHGGIDTDNYGIKTVRNNIYLPYTGGGYSWSSFPFFVVGEGGSVSVDATAVIVSNSPAGNYNVRVSINNINTVSSTNSQTILVIAPTPTPIPPTSTPTLTPTLTPTKIPTLTPTKTPTPTSTIDLNKYSPSPTIDSISPIIEPTDAFESSTPTEEATTTPTPDSESVLGESTPKKNILPLIFICLGALFLLTPLIVVKIKSKQDA